MTRLDWRSGLLAAGALLFLLPGCPGPDPMGADGGPPRADTGPRPDGGGDPCDGITQCAAVGSTCAGGTVVSCAPNAAGCRIETRTTCTSPMVCAVTGGTAMCSAPDVCTGVPIEDRCTTAGRTCDMDTLQDCAMNAAGCLVRTDTDCAAAAGGVCGMDAAGMNACLTPPDPCAAIPMAMRCATAGTSCSTDDLVTCAPNAFGCLVTATTDCTTRAGGACDASGAAAVCTATDPCAGVTTCAAAGAACTAGALVSCAADAFGCLVETSTDCTTEMFGFCSMDAAGGPTCSTGATDPCMGMTTCATAGRMCDMDTLNVCAPNALGCLVETPTDCTTTMTVCSDVPGMPVCVDPCSIVDVCPSATYCDGDAVVACADDANGCLVETGRTACASGQTCGGGATPMCETDLCPEAVRTVIDCGSGTVMGDTAMGTMAIGAYECGGSSYTNMEQLHRFMNGTRMDVQIVATRLTGTQDFDLFVLDAGDPALACTTTDLTCADSSRGVTATETVDFLAEAGSQYFISYDLFGGTAGTTDYSLAITCTPAVCGDSIRASDEACDDGDTMGGDGCSATCTIETGFVCYGAPSVCGAVNTCGNGFTETGETCDDGNTTASDGCSATCAIEPPFRCRTTVQPSVCTPPPFTTTTVAAACVDTTAGTALVPTSLDDGLTPGAALPFAVPYMGASASHFRASTNGFIQLGLSETFTGTSSPSNGTLPNTSTPNGIVAPFWDDLILNTGSEIRTLTSGAAGSRVFVVEYTSARAFGTFGGDGSGLNLRFQVHLRESTGVVEFHYCSMTNSGTGDRHTGASATIGLESLDGTDGTQFSRDTAMSVMTGTAIRFTPVP